MISLPESRYTAVLVDNLIQTTLYLQEVVDEEDEEIYYDKKKSFFDSISCEALERSKG